ncbi:OB-fold nucleic acid binding domain-containing protein [Tessaracoccus sp. SD287]|uniref:OB-fold nucleic acid binding domain-containing protein n=1 Tax=Tessaracoccus sp. SD287 TaxID=2782008 RepID=UPI001A962915|nr:OB-fold nucleic acid binding domain-containing protein [Tessaracoccus sp. SD287]
MGTTEVTGRRPVGMWGRAVRRLTSSNSEFENDQLAGLARESGCQTLSECRARQLVTLHGRINSVTLSPRGGRSWLEAGLEDGTGAVTLVFMGRRSIPGIEAGRMLRATGRLVQRGNRRVIYNPHYELRS